VGGTRPATAELQDRRGSPWGALVSAARRTDVRVGALWLVLGTGLAVLTSRVVDWYIMTDELLYERLALSIAHSYSPLPHIHGELIGNVNQLYPLLLAPVFHGTLIPPALHHAHVLNAFVMSSASIPAFLLARKATGSNVLSYLVAALTVCVPWIVLSSFLMTEVAAYPAFLWAMLALQRAVAAPRLRADVLLVVALGVATLARTQFAVLLVVVPIALFVHQLVFTRADSLWRRVRAAARTIVLEHQLLAALYAALALVGIALAAAGRLSSALGTYSVTAEGNLVPSGMGRSLLEHLAPIGLGLGILPFVLGVAWLLTAVVGSRVKEEHAFAAVALVTIPVLLFEVTSYDLRFGQGRMHDRYLFYVVPLILIAFAAAVRERRWSWWAVVCSAGVLAMAFSFFSVIGYDKLNVDSPVAALNDRLLSLGGSEHGAQALLGLLVIAVTLLLMLLVTFGRKRAVTVLLVLAVIGIPAQTALAFTRLLTVDGTSGRPITVDQGVVFDWIDRELGPGAKVTMVPYPVFPGDYWENVADWWNTEFWNASVRRAAVYEGAFTGTPETFPTTGLSFDRSTGRANVSPSDFVTQAIAETRFRVAGKVRAEARRVSLIEAARPWRTEWLTFDLYRDGWTVPKVAGTIRVFSSPGQTQPMMRFLTINVRGPSALPAREFRIVSNASTWDAKADEAGTSNQLSVCVPAHGYADVHVSTKQYSPIYGDPSSQQTFESYARSGGVLLTGIALADETRPC
jgi:hypothetical protein